MQKRKKKKESEEIGEKLPENILKEKFETEEIIAINRYIG